MPIIDCTSLKVYDGSAWRELRGSKVYDGSAWREIRTGFMICDGANWLRLKDTPPAAFFIAVGDNDTIINFGV